MDGRIGVTSEPGPRQHLLGRDPASRAPRPWRRPRASRSACADALVLEPLDASADALVRLLTELGVRATRVATAGDGLAALEARPAGFAVAFVSLDAIDAAPFVDALQQHPAARHTTIAAIVPAGRRGGADLDRLGSAFAPDPSAAARPPRRMPRRHRRARRPPTRRRWPQPAPPSVDTPARRRASSSPTTTSPTSGWSPGCSRSAATPSRPSATARPPSTRRSIAASTSC